MIPEAARTALAPLTLWVVPVADLGGVARHVLDVARVGLPGLRLAVLYPEGPLAERLREQGAAVFTGAVGPDAGHDVADDRDAHLDVLLLDPRHRTHEQHRALVRRRGVRLRNTRTERRGRRLDLLKARRVQLPGHVEHLVRAPRGAGLADERDEHLATPAVYHAS